MPTFQLDEQPIEFEAGETILMAVQRVGVEIPHYCYHPGLKITAQCRQCLVEITDMGNGRGIPKLQTSCSTPAADGMKVSATSEKARWGQELVNEFLLVNHPLDCSICDQAGECDLQNFAHDYGSGHSEMEYEKRVYGWRDVGSFIMLERNRCIQCSRCERFSRDIVGSHDFGAFLRGHELTFDTFEDSPITHKFQGNLADICPVGSITNRDWRFKKRAWKFRKVESVCPSCSTGCNITLEHHENRVFRIKPRENQSVNRWWMCDEGRLGYKILNDIRNRLTRPQAKMKGKLRPAQWDEVFTALAQRLKEIGATGDQALALCDTHATNEEMAALQRLMSEGFGGGAVLFPLVPGTQQEQPTHPVEDDFIFTLITTDKSPNGAGAQHLGLTGDRDGKRLAAALKASPKVVIVLGAPFGDNKAALDAAGKAELVIYIGPFRNPWSEMADVILPGMTYSEKSGTWINKAGRLQRIRPALKPPAGAMDPLGILAKLLTALGKEPGPSDAGDAFGLMAAPDGPFSGLTLERIGNQGHPLK